MMLNEFDDVVSTQLTQARVAEVNSKPLFDATPAPADAAPATTSPSPRNLAASTTNSKKLSTIRSLSSNSLKIARRGLIGSTSSTSASPSTSNSNSTSTSSSSSTSSSTGSPLAKSPSTNFTTSGTSFMLNEFDDDLVSTKVYTQINASSINSKPLTASPSPTNPLSSSTASTTTATSSAASTHGHGSSSSSSSTKEKEEVRDRKSTISVLIPRTLGSSSAKETLSTAAKTDSEGTHGHLLLLGKSRKGHRRYGVLKGATFSIFRTEKDAGGKADEAIDLSTTNVKADPASGPGCWVVVSKTQQWSFQCNNDSDRDTWIQPLRAVASTVEIVFEEPAPTRSRGLTAVGSSRNNRATFVASQTETAKEKEKDEKEKRLRRLSGAHHSHNRSATPQFRSVRLTSTLDAAGDSPVMTPPGGRRTPNPMYEFYLKIEEQIEIDKLAALPTNATCADCTALKPRWVSLTFGTFICPECSSALRNVLGKNYANVKCMDLSWNSFGPEALQYLRDIGNKRAKEKLESRVTMMKPAPNADFASRTEWITSKYSQMEFYRGHQGVLNVCPYAIRSKKKLAWEKRFMRLSGSNIEIFENEEAKEPLETLDLILCSLKDHRELDLSPFILTKETTPDTFNCFQIITPKQGYFISAENHDELINWNYVIKLATLRIAAQLQTPSVSSDSSSSGGSPSPHLAPVTPSSHSPGHSPAFPPLSPDSLDSPSSTPGEEGALNSSGSGSAIKFQKKGNDPELSSEALMKLLDAVTAKKELQRKQLSQRLQEIESVLSTKLVLRDEARERAEKLKDQIQDLESKQQNIQGRIYQLESEVPSMPTLAQEKVEEEDLNAAAASGQGLLLQDDGSVKGGTIAKLVILLTNEGNYDSEFMPTFMLTYRSFMTPYALVAKLRQRFLIQPPPFIDAETLKIFTETRQRPIRLRVVNVLKHWIGNHYHDFDGDANLAGKLIDLICDTIEAEGGVFAAAADQLKGLLQQKIEGIATAKEVMLDRAKTPKPILPPNLNSFGFEDLDPLEIARQFCLVEQQLYKSILPRELLDQAWSKGQKERMAPNIMNLIRRFNSCSNWCTTMVVRGETAEQRSQVLSKFIILGQHLRSLGNFNALQEILAGLAASPVHRLKHTWALVDPKLMTVYDSLQKDLSRQSNYATLRSIIKTENPPLIPYLGMYLTDLTFIEDGNPNFLSEGLVNYTKRRRIAAVIREIQQYQQTPYNIEAVPEILQWAKDVQGLDETQTYALALIAEPKERPATPAS